MARRCIECNKIIGGSVLDHYRNCHYGTYLANGEDKFLRFPNAFAPESKSAEGQAITKRVAQRKIDKKVSEVQETVPHEPEFIEEAKPVVEDTVETVKPRGKRKRND